MDIKRKLEIADAAIRSIAEHDDADLHVRQAALDAVAALVKKHGDAALQRVHAVVAEQIGADQPAA